MRQHKFKVGDIKLTFELPDNVPSDIVRIEVWAHPGSPRVADRVISAIGVENLDKIDPLNHWVDATCESDGLALAISVCAPKEARQSSPWASALRVQQVEHEVAKQVKQAAGELSGNQAVDKGRVA